MPSEEQKRWAQAWPKAPKLSQDQEGQEGQEPALEKDLPANVRQLRAARAAGRAEYEYERQLRGGKEESSATTIPPERVSVERADIKTIFDSFQEGIKTITTLQKQSKSAEEDPALKIISNAMATWINNQMNQEPQDPLAALNAAMTILDKLKESAGMSGVPVMPSDTKSLVEIKKLDVELQDRRLAHEQTLSLEMKKLEAHLEQMKTDREDRSHQWEVDRDERNRHWKIEDEQRAADLGLRRQQLLAEAEGKQRTGETFGDILSSLAEAVDLERGGVGAAAPVGQPPVQRMAAAQVKVPTSQPCEKCHLDIPFPANPVPGQEFFCPNCKDGPYVVGEK